MPPLSVAIIGCGAVFEFLHRDALSAVVRDGWGKLTAAVDPNPARRALAERGFAGVKTYASAAELFAAGHQIDLTIIASPPLLHRTDAEAAFAAGSHVLCEKPMAHDVADASAMLAAARAAGKLLVLGMPRRFYPAVEVLRGLIAQVPRGTPIKFLFRQGGVYSWPVSSDAPFRREVGGGGVLLDIGVHLIDVAGLLFGWGKTLSAYDDALAGGVEANALIDLQLERARGRLHLSWDTNLDSGLTVQAGEEEFWMPVTQLNVLHHRHRGGTWKPLRPVATWPITLDARNSKRAMPRSHNECMKFQMIGAMRSILHGEKPVASGEDGLATLRIVHEAYTVMQPLEQPWLSADEQAARRSEHWRAGRAEY